jgi:hemerythrin superfamily protein
MTRSIADQTVEELGGPGSVLVRQRRDHQGIDRLLRELETVTGRAQEQVLRRLYRLVFSHAFAEETVLWPVVRRALADGEALTLRVEEEHQDVNELVAGLGVLGHEDPRRGERLSRLVEILREDVRDEEDVLFPQLEEKIDARELRRLGRRWELVRRISPTRPHLTVSRRPPGNALSALPLSLLDRLRDALEAAADRAPGPLASVANGVSLGAAGMVEKASFARRGEKPSTRRRPAPAR